MWFVQLRLPSSPCAEKTIAAEAITVNSVGTTNIAYSYWTSSCLGCKEYKCRLFCFIYVILLCNFQICLILSFWCLLYFDFIIADASLNRPGATLCNSPNHRINDVKYQYMSAEECLSQLNDKLMEFYGVNTLSKFAFGSEASCHLDKNICWFGGAVRKVTLKSRWLACLLFSQKLPVQICSVFKAKSLVCFVFWLFFH